MTETPQPSRRTEEDIVAGILFGVMALLSVICAAAEGNLSALGGALFSGASDAVTLSLSLCGSMCLFCGLLRMLGEMGALGILKRILMPLIRLLFGGAARQGIAVDEIAASLSANLLGLGNAATPLGIAAMDALLGRDAGEDRPPKAGKAQADALQADAAMLVVWNTAPPSLFPTALLALRHAAGSADPAAVLPAVFLTSLCGCVFAAVLTKLTCAPHGRENV